MFPLADTGASSFDGWIHQPLWSDRPYLTLGLAAPPARAEWDAATLPAGDLSRRFAEHDLNIALMELAAGDGDECEERVSRAEDAITNRRYVMRAGEVLKGYGPDDPR